MLTREMILFLLEQLQYKTVSEFREGHYRVQEREGGYSSDDTPMRGSCQAGLSMMLEMRGYPSTIDVKAAAAGIRDLVERLEAEQAEKTT